MFKKQLAVFAFFALNLICAQYTVNQNLAANSAFSFNLEKEGITKVSATNFSDYYTNSFTNKEFDSSKNTLLESPYFVYADSTLTKQKWSKTDTGKSLIIAGGLATVGTIMHFDTSFKVGVRDEITRYLPDFEDTIDDVTQYVPMMAVFALDAVGVRSKHSQMRKLTTLATMTATSLIVVNGLKYSIAEPRPDGTSNNSFPSGHTTTAFMGAHMFHKEYKDKSPFYSIAAYTLATVTGVFRQLNNRHWVSDVFAGAGLGIGVTEFSYFMNDRWWKENGVNDIEILERTINESKPSFLGVKVGYSSLFEESDGESVEGLSNKDGFRISFEGAYFLTKKFGVGGEIGFQSFPISVNKASQDIANAAGYELIPEATGNRLYYFGPYYQIPFGKNVIGTKLQAGVISGPSTKLGLRELGQPDDEIPVDILFADFEPKTSFSWATGIYYKRVLSKNLSMGVYADYNIGDLEYSWAQMDFDEFIANGDSALIAQDPLKVKYDSYAIGINLNVMLW